MFVDVPIPESLSSTDQRFLEQALTPLGRPVAATASAPVVGPGLGGIGPGAPGLPPPPPQAESARTSAQPVPARNCLPIVDSAQAIKI